MPVRSTTLGVLVGLAIAAAMPVATASAAPEAPDAHESTSSDPASRDKSRAAFRRGVAQLRGQEWAAARASFEEAWSLVQHPSILLNLGIARLRTDEPILAEQDLVRFLSEDPGAAAEEIASARDALAEARSKIGTLRVTVSPASARVTIDGRSIAVRGAGEQSQGGAAEARLKMGRHVVVAEAEGFLPQEKSADVQPKADTTIRVTLVPKDAAKPADTATSTRTIVGFSLAGVGVAALAAGGVMALRAMSLSSDYEDAGSPSFQKRDVRDEGIAFRTGADVALVTALLAGAGAVVLLLTDLGSSDAAVVSSGRARRPGHALAHTPGLPTLLRW